MDKRWWLCAFCCVGLFVVVSSDVGASASLLLGWFLDPSTRSVVNNPFFNRVNVNDTLCLWNSSYSTWLCLNGSWNGSVNYNITANQTVFYYPNQTSFLYLNDTPKSYVGNASNCVVVNSTEDGLTFSNCSVGGGSGGGNWLGNYSNGTDADWVPVASNVSDLGNSTNLWNDLYIGGLLIDPTPTWGGSCSIKTACDVGDYSPWDYDSDFVYQKDSALGVFVTNLTVGDWFAVNSTVTNDTVTTTNYCFLSGGCFNASNFTTSGGSSNKSYFVGLTALAFDGNLVS